MEEFKAEPASEGPAPLAPKGWENPPDIKDLKQDLQDAQTSHDKQVTRIKEWLDHLHVRGSAKINTPKGKSQIQPKLIRKQAEWRYAALSEPFLSTSDLFAVNPATWEDVEGARQNALVLNNQFNTRIRKTRFIDRYVRSAVDKGTVIVRVGWEFREEEVEETQPIVEFRPNPALAPLHQELARRKAEDPTSYQYDAPEPLRMAHDLTVESGVPMEPILQGHKRVTVMKTVKNCPTLDVCDFRNVIIDPSCQGDFEKASFIIYSFETSLSQLKKEGRYQNLEHINIDNNSILGDPDHATSNTSDFNFSDQARKKFVAYEYWGYWDFDHSGIAKPFVATWVGDTLIRLEENPFPDQALPFVVVPFMPEDDSVYGEPDGELLRDNQQVTGAVTRGMIDIMAGSANGQTGYRKDALDAANRRKFQQGKDYEYNPGIDPRLAFHTHTYPEIPASAQFMLQQQALEAESMTGVKAFSQGINGNALGDSVGNGRSVLDAASKRETGLLRRLADGMVEIGRKIISMNAEFLDDEEIIRTTNENFVAIRRDQLAGNYDLKLTISTAEEDNAKAQELAFMLQTMGPNLDFGMTKLVMRDIARLRKMPELAKQIENYEPQPDPLEQQIKQLEVAKLQAEIAQIQGRAMEHQSDAVLNQAKTGTEQAKARQLGADADLKNLDFVEQESGVKQEREKELHGEQARAQGQLKLMDHALKKQERRETELEKYLGKNLG